MHFLHCIQTSQSRFIDHPVRLDDSTIENIQGPVPKAGAYDRRKAASKEKETFCMSLRERVVGSPFVRIITNVILTFRILV